MQHHIANSKTPQEYLPRQKVQNLSTKSKSLLIIIIKKKQSNSCGISKLKIFNRQMDNPRSPLRIIFRFYNYVINM